MNNIQPKTLFIGKNYIYLPSCHSTNDIAAEMIQKQSFFDGTIVITSNQTAGRGQRGNSWETLPGQNITCSFILQAKFLKATEQFQLNMAIALGVREFLSKYILPNDALKVKWPNDIYFLDKKLGGILIENVLVGTHIAHSVIGIGLNINQLEFSDTKAISLKSITNADDYELEKLVAELCESIEKYYLQLKNGQSDLQKQLYLRNLYRFQERHLFGSQRKGEESQPFLGQIIGIDAVGKLALEVEGRIQYFGLKEIVFL